MKRINFRKLVLALADVFIIIFRGLIVNFILSFFDFIGAEASKGLLYYIIVDLAMCVVMMFLMGGYSRLWRYFNIKDYLVCALAMAFDFALGYVISMFLQIPQRIIFVL